MSFLAQLALLFWARHYCGGFIGGCVVSNLSVERERPQTALEVSLHGLVAAAATHVKREVA